MSTTGQPGLDLTVWPCHPVGTWQRALTYRAAGLIPEQDDARALEQWSQHTDYVRRRACVTLYKTTTAVRRAAVAALEPGEVVGADKLARRITGAPGVPHCNRTTALLKAVAPYVPGERVSLGGGGGLHKAYMPKLGGRPGHYFTLDPANFPVFAQAKLDNARRIGRINGVKVAATHHRTAGGTFLPAGAA